MVAKIAAQALILLCFIIVFAISPTANPIFVLNLTKELLIHKMAAMRDEMAVIRFNIEIISMELIYCWLMIHEQNANWLSICY